MKYFSNTKSKILWTGDFNLPDLKWPYIISKNDNNIITNKSKTLLESMGSLNLIQVNEHHNSSNNILDLILMNFNHHLLPDLFIETNPLVKPDNYHPPFYFNLDFKIHKTDTIIDDQITYNFNKADDQSFAYSIINTDWQEIISPNNVDDTVVQS